MLKGIIFTSGIFDYDEEKNMYCVHIFDDNKIIVGTIYFKENFKNEFIENYKIIKIIK